MSRAFLVVIRVSQALVLEESIEPVARAGHGARLSRLAGAARELLAEATDHFRRWHLSALCSSSGLISR